MNDPLDTLAKVQAATARVVYGVRSDQYDDPTPCTEMDVRALLKHLVTCMQYFASVVDGVPYDVDSTPDVTAGDPAAAYDEAAHRVTAAWSAPGAFDRDYDLPFGRMPAAIALGTVTQETLVHGWDLAHATGQVLEIDPSIPEEMLAIASSMLGPTGRDAGVPFADAVPIADDAPALDRLVAYLGRRP